MTTDELITIRQAADRLAISIVGVRRLVKAGKLRACRPGDGGRTIRLYASDVDRHITRCTTTGAVGTDYQPSWVRIQ